MRKLLAAFILIVFACSLAAAVEAGKFRLLSIAETGKIILISTIPQKAKYVLDASTAKITVDGKPAEFSALGAYSVVNVKFELKKSTRTGIDLDGVASEIRVLTPENTKISSNP